jgi:hypothetical protein
MAKTEAHFNRSGRRSGGDKSVGLAPQKRVLTGDEVIHMLRGGFTPCGMLGLPRDWPAGHLWAVHWPDVNCGECLAKRPSL